MKDIGARRFEFLCEFVLIFKFDIVGDMLLRHWHILIHTASTMDSFVVNVVAPHA
jgi:hypothetical protein